MKTTTLGVPLCLSLFLFQSTAMAQQMTPCSTTFVCLNGNVAGPVNSEDSCEEACRACEGYEWRCDDFETLTDQVTMNPTEFTTTTLEPTDPETAPPVWGNSTNSSSYTDTTTIDNNDVELISVTTRSAGTSSSTLNTAIVASVSYYECKCYKHNDANVCDGSGGRLDLCADPGFVFTEQESGASSRVTTASTRIVAALAAGFLLESFC